MPTGRHKIVVWNNNRTFSEVLDHLKGMGTKYEWSYMHAAQEKCPTTNKAHVDGYYETIDRRRLSTELNKFKKVFGPGWGNLQIARGNAGENIDYSEKEEGTFYVQGTVAPTQGERVDIKRKCDEILAGETTVDQEMKEDPEFYHKYGRTMRNIEDIALRDQFRTEMTTGIWYWGPTGTGKSHTIFKNYSPKTHYIWKNDKGWQDGYVGQPIVIINEFRGHIAYNDLLEMLDKYPLCVSRRGREPAPFLAKQILISSSLAPEDVYRQRNEKDSLTQLLRRIQVVNLTEVYVADTVCTQGSNITP
ncbi:MAG: helicase [Cressdnaviricota sp.]|nr:MAG: helicase [Cressdnaviricota sp.]